MAKEEASIEMERKKEKKERKEKRSEKDGVHKSKKDKNKDKKKPIVDQDRNYIPTTTIKEESLKPEGIRSKEPAPIAKPAPLIGALVPFANPLADEKNVKKILKSVRKAAKAKCLKRGVKEVVKSLRKSPPSVSTTISTSTSTPASSSLPFGVVVIAADISPMDVISHLPVLCEDHDVPYIFVPSRAELGAAGATKRPTSVVLVGKERGGKKKKTGGEEGRMEGIVEGAAGEVGEFEEVYRELVRVVMKAGRGVKV